MNTVDYILAFSGTAVGSALIGGWINRKKDQIEVRIKEQTFYKQLIKDLDSQREKEKKERLGLQKKIDELKKTVEEFMRKDEEKTQQIEDLKNTVKRWEENTIELKGIITQKDRQISNLFQQIERHEGK